MVQWSESCPNSGEAFVTQGCIRVGMYVCRALGVEENAWMPEVNRLPDTLGAYLPPPRLGSEPFFSDLWKYQAEPLSGDDPFCGSS